MTDSDIRDKATDCAEIEPVHVEDGLALDEGEWTAIRRFIKAVVAHIHEDRDDPVTAEWLKAKGFKGEVSTVFVDADGNETTWWVLEHPERVEAVLTLDCDDDFEAWSAYLGDAEGYNPWPHDIRCRGQVYDICRALGHPLKGDAK